MKIQPAFLTFILTGAFLFSPLARSAQVTQVKGKKVLIDLESAEINEGEEFFLINPETTKKTAIIRIKTVKGGKALGDIIKGSAAAPGDTLEAKGSSARPMSAPVEEDRPARTSGDTGYLKIQRDSWGILGEYLMTNMSASFSRPTPTTHTATTDMKGSGFGASGFYNHMLTKDFSAFMQVGIQQFNASGATTLADCDSGFTCDVKINYLSFYGSARYYFSQAKNRFWAGLGFGYLMALSKSSTVLNSSQISSNQVITLSLGGDYQLSKRNYIPYGLEYAMFPSSSSVKANMIVLKGGYGWNF